MATVEELVARLQALGFAPGEATNEGVATVVAEPGPTRTAIDARVTGIGDTRYAPVDEVPQVYQDYVAANAGSGYDGGTL